jgi:hypothetical protein
MIQFYIAGYHRAHEAEQAVSRALMAPGALDEIVSAERELTKEEIRHLKLEELEVRNITDDPAALRYLGLTL